MVVFLLLRAKTEEQGYRVKEGLIKQTLCSLSCVEIPGTSTVISTFNRLIAREYFCIHLTFFQCFDHAAYSREKLTQKLTPLSGEFVGENSV